MGNYQQVKLFLLLALFGLASIASGRDCVPATFKYLADSYGINHSIHEWTISCQTTESGTDVYNIISGWNSVAKNRLNLLPVYVAEDVGNEYIDHALKSFRPVLQNRDVELETKQYLWLGIYPDQSEDGAFLHCAVATFYPSGVIIMSPNSWGVKGRFVKEFFDYQTFFQHTIIVLEITEYPMMLFYPALPSIPVVPR